MPRRQVALEEVLSVAQRGTTRDLHKVLPGIVVAYNASAAPSGGTPGRPASVDVEVAVHDVLEDDDGELESEPWPILPEVPLGCIQLGGFSIRAKAQKGDRVLLLSYDLDPTKHVLTGEAEDPLFPGRHTGSFWIAVPYDITDPGALEDPGDDLVVGVPGGPELRIGTSDIRLGRTATDFVALSTPVFAALDALKTAVTGLGGVVAPTFPVSASDIAATLTKAK